MPVILSTAAEMQLWLSPAPWSPPVEALVRPLAGDTLEVYKVPQEVGKVQNDSPDFIQPIADRKGNIASLFAKQQQSSPPRKDASELPDLSKPALRMTSPTQTKTAKAEPMSVKVAPKQASPKAASPEAKPKPTQIDSFFKKETPSKGKSKASSSGKKREHVEPKVEDDSSDLEVVEEPSRVANRSSPRKKVKHNRDEDGEDEVVVVEDGGDGTVKREKRGVQEEVNAA